MDHWFQRVDAKGESLNQGLLNLACCRRDQEVCELDDAGVSGPGLSGALEEFSGQQHRNTRRVASPEPRSSLLPVDVPARHLEGGQVWIDLTQPALQGMEGDG